MGRGRKTPSFSFAFSFFPFLVWKDGKCMLPHLENCCAAGWGR